MLVKIKIKKKLPLPKLKSSSNSTNYGLPFFNSVPKKKKLPTSKSKAIELWWSMYQKLYMGKKSLLRWEWWIWLSCEQ